MLAGDGCVGPQGIANEVGMSLHLLPPSFTIGVVIVNHLRHSDTGSLARACKQHCDVLGRAEGDSTCRWLNVRVVCMAL